MRDHQRQSEQIVEATFFETICDDSGEPFTLVDSKLGVISKARLPYVLKHVRMNGRHLQYMLDHLQEMPSELETHYEAMDSVSDVVDLSAYVPSQPRLVLMHFIVESLIRNSCHFQFQEHHASHDEGGSR